MIMREKQLVTILQNILRFNAISGKTHSGRIKPSLILAIIAGVYLKAAPFCAPL